MPDCCESGHMLDAVLDSGWLPHTIIRMGARRQTANRIAEIASPDTETHIAKKMAFVEELKTMDIAIETDAANKQHYETPIGLLTEAMGPRVKYSSSLFPKGNETLAEAEEAMLADYVTKAGIVDGMSIVDIGSGWGSASLYLAEKFPNSRVTAISNSKVQKGYVEGRANELGLKNLTVIAANIVHHEFEPESFDRAISIEMFEHMKNYELLLAKVARALKPGGKLFVHVFAHKDTPYHFEEGWMTRYFFTGGTMPSADLFLYFQKDLKLEKQWWINGTHYQKSLEAWLKKFVANKKKVWPVLAEGYGAENANAWYNRWQCFFIGCAEFFGYEGGNTFGVAHFLFVKPGKA